MQNAALLALLATPTTWSLMPHANEALVAARGSMDALVAAGLGEAVVATLGMGEAMRWFVCTVTCKHAPEPLSPKLSPWKPQGPTTPH